MQRSMSMTMVLGTAIKSKDNAAIQGMQVRLSPYQVRDNVPMFGLHGDVSRPLPGAQMAIAMRGDDPSTAVCIGTNDPRYYRFGLPDGTVGKAHHLGGHVLLFDDRIEINGNDKQVVITNARTVVMTSASQVLLDAPDVFATKNLHAGTGASGTFATPAGNIVTVRDGIIVNIT